MDDTPHRGTDRIPPGQYVTEKWPVLTYGRTPVVSPKDWGLRLFGQVEQPVALMWTAFQSLRRIEVTADFHCVTRFSTLDNRWSGVSTRDVSMQARVLPDAAFVSVHCYGGYATNLPLEDFLSEHALFADRWNGEPLPVDHGGPVRLVVPHLYAWKSAKWVSGIEFLAEDRRGFWEENGYHSYGDPWTEERFSSQETRNAGQVRRRAKELGIVPEENQGQLPNSIKTP